MLLYKITVASGLVLKVVISVLNFSWRLGGGGVVEAGRGGGGREVGHII